MKTTLRKIHTHNPCVNGWAKLMGSLGKTEVDDEPLAIRSVLDSNGIKDAIWALRAVEGYDAEIYLFALSCLKEIDRYLTTTTAEKILGNAGFSIVKSKSGIKRSAYDAFWASNEAVSITCWNEYGVTPAITVDGMTIWTATATRLLAAQEKEFRRMLKCVESGETYELGRPK